METKLAKVISGVRRGRREPVRRRATAAAASFALLAALLPAAAQAAVPKASWYWSLAVSSSDPSALVLATGSGLYRSSDGGHTWKPSGLAGVDVTSVAQTGPTLVAAGDRTSAKTPVVVEHGGYYVSPGVPVFALSTNGGTTWQVRQPQGLPDVPVQALAIDPSSGALYAVLRTGAVYRSADRGVSFTLVSKAVGGTPWALAITRAGHLVAGDMTTGNYVSGNASAWRPTGFRDSRGGGMVMEYAAQPSDPLHVLMTSYGVVSSSDGGTTWATSLRSKVMFGPVAWAPSATGTAYAVGFDRSLWKTVDGGKSWSELT